MFLDKIIGTSTKVNVLNFLINNPEKRFIEMDLAKKANASVSEINRQMPDLIESGLVCMERLGKAKLYSINKNYFLVKELKGLFTDLNKVYLNAARKISKFAKSSSKNLEAVILIGSVAVGKVKSDLIKEPSDIDLVFIVENESSKKPLFNSLVSFINREISSRYGFVCYPIVLSRKEYIDALEKKDSFIVKVHVEGVELYGGKPRRFGKMGN